MNERELQVILDRCQFNNWTLRAVERGPVNGVPDVFLYVLCVKGKCNDTGREKPWFGRAWFIDQGSDVSDVVRTAFMAVMAAVEHETREQFKYRGEAVFGPHGNVESIAWNIRAERDRLATEAQMAAGEAAKAGGEA